jgi:hypothetical protein
MLPRPMELMLSIMHKGGYGIFNLDQLMRLPRATADQGPFALASQTESPIMFRPMRDEFSERVSATFGGYKPNSRPNQCHPSRALEATRTLPNARTLRRLAIRLGVAVSRKSTSCLFS